MVSKDVIRQIKEKTDIVEIISSYVVLKKKGKNWQGLCPFHSEKTPSFTVSPQKLIWHCFGCGQGGNVFEFMMKINNASFEAVLGELAEKAGIVIENLKHTFQESAEHKKYYKILKEAEEYFSQCLANDKNSNPNKYLEERKIDKDTITQFKLGYATSGWHTLFKEFSKKYSPHNLEEVGLIIKREGTSEYFDCFRDRIIFPIRDNRGRTIAFGGRVVGKSENDLQPKYLNSPETSVYHKSKNLYALDIARQSITKMKQVIIVEGYLDAILAHAFGFTNTVATLGTALTNEHIYHLGRHLKDVYLCFDNDQAGKEAAMRSGDALKARGKKVKVVVLKRKDPAEVLASEGRDVFLKNIVEAKPYLEFCLGYILEKFNLNEVEEVAEAINEAVSILKREREKIVREKYAKDLAKRLRIDSNIILNKLNEDLGHHFYRNKERKYILSKPKKNKYFKAEEILLMSMACYKESREKIFKHIEPQDFIDETHVKLAEVLCRSSDSMEDIMEKIEDDSAKKILREITIKEEEIHDNLIEGCIKTIKEYHFKERTKKLLNEIDEAEKSGNHEHADIKRMEYRDLYQQQEVLGYNK